MSAGILENIANPTESQILIDETFQKVGEDMAVLDELIQDMEAIDFSALNLQL